MGIPLISDWVCCFFKSYSLLTFARFLNFYRFFAFFVLLVSKLCYCDSSQNKPSHTVGYLSSALLLLSSLNQTNHHPTPNYIILWYRKGLTEVFHTNRTVELVTLFLQEVLVRNLAVYRLSWLSFIVVFLSSYMAQIRDN